MSGDTVSWRGDDELDSGSASADEAPSSPGWMVAGYFAGILSMSAAPSLFFGFSATVSWPIAPLVPLLIAFACVLAGTMDRRFHTAAAGAAAAAAFGAVAVTTLFLGLVIIS